MNVTKTVKELIEKLRKMPKDKEIRFDYLGKELEISDCIREYPDYVLMFQK